MGVLQGKVAIVAGGGTGVGRTISTALAAAGARVAIVDVDESVAAVVTADLESFGAQALPIGCDVSNADEIIMAVNATADWFGTVDILVTTGQAGGGDIALEDMTDADFDRALTIGPKSTFRFMRACHPYLVDGGRVINIRPGAEMVAVQEAATQDWDWYGIAVDCVSCLDLAEKPMDIGPIVVSLALDEPLFVPSDEMRSDRGEILVA